MSTTEEFLHTYGISQGDAEYAVTPGVASQIAATFGQELYEGERLILTLRNGQQIEVVQWKVH